VNKRFGKGEGNRRVYKNGPAAIARTLSHKFNHQHSSLNRDPHCTCYISLPRSGNLSNRLHATCQGRVWDQTDPRGSRISETKTSHSRKMNRKKIYKKRQAVPRLPRKEIYYSLSRNGSRVSLLTGVRK
jgi:hypothetical protein